MKVIQSVFKSHTWEFMALIALMLASGGLASAQGQPPKHGRLTLTRAARIGNVVLESGEYKVRIVDSANGSQVEFVRETVDTRFEGVQAAEEEVVASVTSIGRALSASSKHTQLRMPRETPRAVAVEIRGDAMEYVFAPLSTEQPAAMAAGIHEGAQ